MAGDILMKHSVLSWMTTGFQRVNKDIRDNFRPTGDRQGKSQIPVQGRKAPPHYSNFEYIFGIREKIGESRAYPQEEHTCTIWMALDIWIKCGLLEH